MLFVGTNKIKETGWSWVCFNGLTQMERFPVLDIMTYTETMMALKAMNATELCALTHCRVITSGQDRDRKFLSVCVCDCFCIISTLRSNGDNDAHYLRIPLIRHAESAWLVRYSCVRDFKTLKITLTCTCAHLLLQRKQRGSWANDSVPVLSQRSEGLKSAHISARLKFFK